LLVFHVLSQGDDESHPGLLGMQEDNIDSAG